MKTADDLADPGAVFGRHRRRLLGIAYRMLGSMWDAQDVVAEASVRWLRTDHTTVQDAAAFLTTMVSRLALDELRSARRSRQSYIGPWLPEPLLTDPANDPLEHATRRDSLHFATLRLLERLAPPERAVYVLREAFDLPFSQIADVVNVTEANARQLLHRARQRMGGDARFEADRNEHMALLDSFLRAVTVGDLDALTDLLADDVVAYTDGGGKVRAAPVPIVGRDNVARFLGAILRRFPITAHTIVEANGLPAARLLIDDRRPFVAIEVRHGEITGIDTVMNPDKLRYIDHQLPHAGCIGAAT